MPWGSKPGDPVPTLRQHDRSHADGRWWPLPGKFSRTTPTRWRPAAHRPPQRLTRNPPELRALPSRGRTGGAGPAEEPVPGWGDQPPPAGCRKTRRAVLPASWRGREAGPAL